MPDDKTQPDLNDDAAENAPGNGDATAAQTNAQDAADVAAGQATALQKEIDTLKTKLLHAMADYQTLARRGRQEAVDARQQQTFDIAKSLVNVLDHFDRALEVDPTKVSTKSLLQGLQLVNQEMHKTLEAFGIKRIEVKPGDEFNPHCHEAMMRQAVDGIASNHIASVFQPGYALGDRTIRPAKVSVGQ